MTSLQETNSNSHLCPYASAIEGGLPCECNRPLDVEPAKVWENRENSLQKCDFSDFELVPHYEDNVLKGYLLKPRG